YGSKPYRPNRSGPPALHDRLARAARRGHPRPRASARRARRRGGRHDHARVHPPSARATGLPRASPTRARRSVAARSRTSRGSARAHADVAELVRGRSGRLLGDLVAVLTTLKGLPMAYNSDLQEQRVPLYDATYLADALSVLALVVRGVRFDREAMRRATERGMLAATDLADHLAKRGVPFREAHEIVGKIVRERLAAGMDLGGVTLSELRGYDKRFEASALDEIRPERSLA